MDLPQKPWEALERKTAGKVDGYLIADTQGNYVAQVNVGTFVKDGKDKAKAVADHIVTACNLHDDLLEIVQELSQWEHHGQYVMTPSTLWKDTDKTWAQQIAEVLKKAGIA